MQYIVFSAKENIEERTEMKDMSVNQLIEAATMMSHVPILTHGKFIHRFTIYLLIKSLGL